MRIRVSHLTSYRYETPATGVIQILRLTPRNHDGQYVARWRIDVSADCRLDQHEDAFGNITHAFTADGPLTALEVLVEGEVETRDTQGIVRGAVERFPPSLYLRETALTRPDGKIAELAACEPRDGGRRRPAAAARPARAAARRHHLRHRSHPRRHHGGGGLRARPRGLPGSHPYLHRCRAQRRRAGALRRRLFPPRRRGERAGGRPCLGRGLRPRARLGRLRPRQRDLRHRCPCAGGRRPRLSRAPRRCAARATAAPARRSRSRCASRRRSAQQTQS